MESHHKLPVSHAVEFPWGALEGVNQPRREMPNPLPHWEHSVAEPNLSLFPCNMLAVVPAWSVTVSGFLRKRSEKMIWEHSC